MDFIELSRLYINKNYSEIEGWINKQSNIEAKGTISLMLLCAAILMQKKTINGIEIDTEYLKSRDKELDDFYNATVWHWLAYSGNYDALIKAINEKRFDPNTLQNKNGSTVWHWLALSGNYDALSKAIKEKRFDQSKNGATVCSYLVLSTNENALPSAIKDGYVTPDYALKLAIVNSKEKLVANILADQRITLKLTDLDEALRICNDPKIKALLNQYKQNLSFDAISAPRRPSIRMPPMPTFARLMGKNQKPDEELGLDEPLLPRDTTKNKKPKR